MATVSRDLLRLGPLNPILLRVVTAGGRRLRHAFIRWGYLALLIGVLLIALLQSTVGGGSSLSDLAKASAHVFEIISYVQLGMICLLAPIFTAGAITQERDSRTYNILLATPLTNGQIVLGSLLSRLYFVLALLLSGIPVFAITLFYGGVTARGIVLSFAIAMSTGLFTGALAIAIAVFRLGTGKTVFWFFVLNAVYLVGLYLVDGAIGGGTSTTWVTGIHPFLALKAVMNPSHYMTPTSAELAYVGAWRRWYLAHPAAAYLVLTLSASVVLVTVSAIVLRRIAQKTDVGFTQFLRHLIFPKWENKERRARHVWTNPVAWREAATRAGASVRGITRWSTIFIGLAAAVVLLGFYHTGQINVEDVRQWLTGLVLVEFTVSLLVATNISASAVTRERESQTLDLLLVTPITSRYYIWGKLRGLVSFMLPFAAVPTLTILLVVLYDLLGGHYMSGSAAEPIVWAETVIELPIFLTVLMAWACMLGLKLSLHWTRTIVAVMASVGVIAGVCAALGVCGFSAVKGIKTFGLAVNSFSPFTALTMLLDPRHFAPEIFTSGSGGGSDEAMARVVMFISVLTASGVYCGLVWSIYRAMVKNFDMIIRRQHQ